MHIQDGLLDLKTCLATSAVAAAAVGYALRRARQGFADRTAPVMGVVAACLFAAQMMNFPIPGGTSGHLLGGVLAMVLLGPWSGLLVITVVLVVQCLLFQDGGVTALGANIFNVGVIGSLVGYTIYSPLRRWVGGERGTVVGAVVAAWFSVVLGAAACSIELAASGTFQLAPTLGLMLIIHSMIGCGEALITGLTLAFVLRTRPDLAAIQTVPTNAARRIGQLVIAGLAIAFFIAVILSPLASQRPDGLERSLERLGVAPESFEPLIRAWTPVAPGWEKLRAAGSVAAGAGTAVVFGVAFFLARGLSPKSSFSHSPNAS